MYTPTRYGSLYAGHFARLHSPVIEFKGNTCLTFFYHLYGSEMGTLRVYVDGTKRVFQASGQKGNRWRVGWTTISLSGNYTVRNIAIAGSLLGTTLSKLCPQFQGDTRHNTT